MTARSHLAFALDFPSIEEARAAVAELAPFVGVLKIGLELFVREGPPAVAFARSLGLDVFLDLKLHDIPETVERATLRARALGVRFLTVHAAGGEEMLRRAVAAATAPGPHPPVTILAVTVLTSLDAVDLAATGVAASPREQALRLVDLAWEAGVRGFVSSAEEASALRASKPEAFLVTPGIRFEEGSAASDQKRVATPERAIADGANLLVVGRPLRDAVDRPAAARALLAGVEAGLAKRP